MSTSSLVCHILVDTVPVTSVLPPSRVWLVTSWTPRPPGGGVGVRQNRRCCHWVPGRSPAHGSCESRPWSTFVPWQYSVATAVATALTSGVSRHSTGIAACSSMPRPSRVSTTEWETSPTALARIAREGLAGPHELHGWFLRQVAEHLVSRGRRPVSWEPIGHPGAVVMPWRDAADAHLALDRGHDVVMAPHRSTYLDYPQSTDPDEPAGQPGLVVTAHDVYHVPLPTGVLGAQCALWTEYVPTARHLERLAFPRLAALADALWTRRPSWADFTDRMRGHAGRLAALSVPHGPLTTREEDEDRSPAQPC